MLCDNLEVWDRVGGRQVQVGGDISIPYVYHIHIYMAHSCFSLSCIGEGKGNPLQCSCLENPRDGGAWWAAVYGAAQSRTRLKRLSSSSIHADVRQKPTQHYKPSSN